MLPASSVLFLNSYDGKSRKSLRIQMAYTIVISLRTSRKYCTRTEWLTRGRMEREYKVVPSLCH
jgi:hypothetical protein